MARQHQRQQCRGGFSLARAAYFPLLKHRSSVGFVFLLALLSFSVSLVSAQDNANNTCSLPKFALTESTQNHFRVGVLAIRGPESALREWTPTFSTYLTARVGRLFDPPLTFEVVPMALAVVLEQALAGNVDFVFANPSVYSCIDSEVGSTSLATMVSRRNVGGQVHRLNRFGGVIFTLANNSAIQSIQDLRNATIATASISGLGSGQMQFREMQRAGLHHLQDPRQIIFTSNQNKVVAAVLTGQVDCGFVRTDQLERSKDPTNDNLPLDLDKVKIIGARQGLEMDSSGQVFPFPSSTTLYPEWPLAALGQVDSLVKQQVQAALYELADHAAVAPLLQECMSTQGCADTDGDQACEEACFETVPSTLFRNCDTTREMALLAQDAKTSGKFEKWGPSLSYMELRNMQEETGFIDVIEGKPQCTRSSTLSEAITCPPGHFKKPAAEVETGCEDLGLPCFGFQCICSPCVKAFDVDVLPVYETSEEQSVDRQQLQQSGCSKFSICGTVQQYDQITLVAIDNKKRADAVFTATVLTGENEEAYTFLSTEDEEESPYEYTLTLDATDRPTGIIILDVFVNGEQIPESPFRLQILPRDCELDTGDKLRVPDNTGQCVCDSESVEFGNRCVPWGTLLISTLVPFCVICIVLVLLYANHNRRKADALWHVDPKELHFHDPPRTLGRGTFGLVLLAEYRGTQVAVKRVLPAKDTVLEQPSARANEAKKHAIFGSLREVSSSQKPSVLPESAPPEVVGESPMVTSQKSVKFGNCTLTELQEANPEDGRKSHFDFQGKENANYRSQRYFRSSDNIGLKSGFVAGSKSRSSKSGSSGWLSQTRTKSAKSTELKNDFIAEMRCISKLRHPCVVTVMGAVIDDSVCAGLSVKPRLEPMLVMEHMEFGSLYDLLHNESMVLEGDVLLPILVDIAKGMRFLHAAEPQIIHGDLKSQNILVDANFRAKVADFGFTQKRRGKATGTPFWMAPETLLGTSVNTAASDAYSFGVVLYEVFSRKEPYEGENPELVLKGVVDENVKTRPPVPSDCPAEAANIMKACLKHDPEERPTFEDIDVRLRMLDADSMEPGEHSPSYQKKQSELATRARTDALLYDMFPKRIADALKNGKKIEPEHHESCTVFFADIVGYTKIADSLSAAKVTSLLDRLYTKFDHLCEIHNTYKVEIAGDAYMCTTNVDIDQPEHTRIMANFALDAIEACETTLIDEDDSSRGQVKIRVGFHTGPVVAHVVGSRQKRFSIIGDTVNVASRLESMSEPGRIQVSEHCAQLLREQAPDLDITYRGELTVKGKGQMRTYFVKSYDTTRTSLALTDDGFESSMSDTSGSSFKRSSATLDRLIDWNVGILSRLLQQIVAHRRAKKSVGSWLMPFDPDRHKDDVFSENHIAIDEVKEVIPLPEYNSKVAKRVKHYDSIELSEQVATELRSFVSIIAHSYRDNDFHNFEHASHVTMQLTKLLGNVVVPQNMEELEGSNSNKSSKIAHQYSHGIASDPLTQFAVVFSAIIHDADHPGVPNAQLIEEGTPLAARYKEQSIAEQNSVSISWEHLMDPKHANLRALIYQTEEEYQHFRQLVVNTVLATDIVDKQLKQLRNNRWQTAFSESSPIQEDALVTQNRKATIVIEHMIQAADVSHTMQHFNIYRKWNERFFRECYKAFLDGRAEKDPCDGWYQGELGFFDFYIIPLAKKLKDCGVFGSSDDNLAFAMKNRRLWEERGREIVAEMIEKLHQGEAAAALSSGVAMGNNDHDEDAAEFAQQEVFRNE